MKIAMFLKDENMKKINVASMRVLVFTADNGFVTGMEEHKMYNNNLNFVSIWLIDKQVDTIYLQAASEEIVIFFRRMNITVKTYEDANENQFLKSFLI